MSDRLFKRRVLQKHPYAFCERLRESNRIWCVYSMGGDKGVPLGTAASAAAAWKQAYMEWINTERQAVAENRRAMQHRDAERHKKTWQDDMRRKAISHFAKTILQHVSQGEDRGTNDTRMAALYRIRNECERIVQGLTDGTPSN